MAIIAPSILSADFTQLGQEIRSVEKAGADWIHIDVMDGHFVPNITYGAVIVEAARKSCQIPLDVHLMIEKPDLLIPDFIAAGADLISVHVEACTHLHRTLQLIRASGAKAGVALNPATPLESISWILEELDFVLIMSVNPGFGGQKFIRSSLEKVRQLSAMIHSRRLGTIIQVDGGVSMNTIREIKQAGASSFVAGSAIFNTLDYARTISALRHELEE
ncbi:MAG: ribulose-phosphate 3-epimerase [Pseudomonadota bacterium]